MIDRYTRPEMRIIWDQDHRFGKMLQVEIAVADVQAQMKMIPKSAFVSIKKKAKYNIKRISEIEKVTKHDVIAFVSCVAESVGEQGKFLHYGLTSSDVLDTAFSLQVKEAGEVLLKSVDFLEQQLIRKIKKHKWAWCPGRTHGMFAEPTTFGLKLAGFLSELRRNKVRFKTALKQMEICKLSGAVGTYSSQSIEVEKKVAKKLKLTSEVIATQVIPRDRHAELIWSLSMIGNFLERLSVELRHLQRSEVSEVIEGFTQGQKGSSAMPHKKNPISAENITGASRLLRSYALAAAENVALWHERDISHSSVERVIFPDAFILCDYALHRMGVLIDGLYVNESKMKFNIDLSQGQLYSSHVLLALVQKGLSREEAYYHVQRLCHTLSDNSHLAEQINSDEFLSQYLNKSEVEAIFSGKRHQKNINKIFSKIKL